jgi:uncharacterized protein YdhG (YjbR/CyaY superfamily)
MPRSSATTPEAYLAELSSERRADIAAVRDVIRKNLPEGYDESVNWGMISYGVPLERYPNTYNKQPLCYVGLAAQKNYNALYLMRVYGDKAQEKRLRDAFKKAGKKLDMGKSCVRFRKADDLPLDTIGEIVASTPVDTWIAVYESSRRR